MNKNPLQSGPTVVYSTCTRCKFQHVAPWWKLHVGSCNPRWDQIGSSLKELTPRFQTSCGGCWVWVRTPARGRPYPQPAGASVSPWRRAAWRWSGTPCFPRGRHLVDGGSKRKSNERHFAPLMVVFGYLAVWCRADGAWPEEAAACPERGRGHADPPRSWTQTAGRYDPPPSAAGGSGERRWPRRRQPAQGGRRSRAPP